MYAHTTIIYGADVGDRFEEMRQAKGNDSIEPTANDYLDRVDPDRDLAIHPSHGYGFDPCVLGIQSTKLWWSEFESFMGSVEGFPEPDPEEIELLHDTLEDLGFNPDEMKVEYKIITFATKD
jgi:hypothetical protein